MLDSTLVKTVAMELRRFLARTRRVNCCFQIYRYSLGWGDGKWKRTLALAMLGAKILRERGNTNTMAFILEFVQFFGSTIPHRNWTSSLTCSMAFSEFRQLRLQPENQSQTPDAYFILQFIGCVVSSEWCFGGTLGHCVHPSQAPKIISRQIQPDFVVRLTICWHCHIVILCI